MASYAASRPTLRAAGPFCELELRVGGWSGAGERVRDHHDALALLRSVFGPAPSDPRLRSLLFEAGAWSTGLDDHELLDRIARLVVRGEIEVVVVPRIASVSESVERAELAHVTSEPAPLEDADHWIELVVQTAAGIALPGVRCEIGLPWGTVLTRTTDRFGLIRLDRLPQAGECTVRVIGLDDLQEPEPIAVPREWALVSTYTEDELALD